VDFQTLRALDSGSRMMVLVHLLQVLAVKAALTAQLQVYEDRRVLQMARANLQLSTAKKQRGPKLRCQGRKAEVVDMKFYE